MIGGDHSNLEFHPDVVNKRSFRVSSRVLNKLGSLDNLLLQVSVEGNIASGKSTILKMLGEYKDVEVRVRTAFVC